ncbi:hypothetical protein [Pseudonocardia acidicola]|uniref:Uncharacterized protein n=1 Tax=Pseudonocardia acidicola TaxID=2724939 RepID=A0ABX1SFX1_9PSEU|nr:hypothetical protein [Pseudonocardia acidicola]NMH99378.1 hypothetical protein [Pseudonocardia acidicola]
MTEPIDTDSRLPDDVQAPDIEIPGEAERKVPDDEDVIEQAGTPEPPD